jgi:Fis family transcriptional regulator
MGTTPLEDCIRASLEMYFRDLGGTEPTGVYGMVMRSTERPLLEVVMARAGGNQSRAAQWLSLNRNTLRKKLQEHQLI